MYVKNLAIAAALCVTISGCKTDMSTGTAPDVELTRLDQLPQPSIARFAALEPFDRIEIVVPQDPSMSGIYIVDDQGYIFFPYLDRVQAENRTPTELAQVLRAGLAKGVLVDPSVNVVPADFKPPSISVGGQVNKPGAYPSREAPTLMQVVNLAGGTTEYAKLDDVLIFRTVDGQRYIGIYNLSAIVRGNYSDPEVFPGDVIMVGDSPARRRLEAILQLVQPALSGAVLLERVVN